MERSRITGIIAGVCYVLAFAVALLRPALYWLVIPAVVIHLALTFRSAATIDRTLGEGTKRLTANLPIAVLGTFALCAQAVLVGEAQRALIIAGAMALAGAVFVFGRRHGRQ